jgi:hypothetical protein
MLSPSSGLKCVGSGIFALVYRWAAMKVAMNLRGVEGNERNLDRATGKERPF